MNKQVQTDFIEMDDRERQGLLGSPELTAFVKQGKQTHNLYAVVDMAGVIILDHLSLHTHTSTRGQSSTSLIRAHV